MKEKKEKRTKSRRKVEKTVGISKTKTGYKASGPSKLRTFFRNFSDDTSKLNRTDVKVILCLVIIYAIFALFNLGTAKAPQTYYKFEYSGDDVGMVLDTQAQNVSKIVYYTGAETGSFMVMTSLDGIEYHNLTTFKTNSVFSWEELAIDKDLKYIKFVAEDVDSYLGDVQVYDAYGDKIAVKALDDQSSVIVDELNTVPSQIGYKNSAYFDEVYFARSAWEYVHGVNTMEWTHPPLGKLLMALPVLLFGFSPFTYRIMGALAGLLMIPVIYILAKRLFKNRKWALLAGLLMTFDNFHLAHTRMGTVDSFLVLFILLSVLFMKDYIDLDSEIGLDNSLKKKYKLLLSGLFIGCAVTTKWTALYALLGMAIVFFTHLFKKYEDKRKTRINYNKASKMTLLALVILSLIPIIAYYGVLMVKSSLATTVIFGYYLVVCLVTTLILLRKLIKKDKKLKSTFVVCGVAFILIPAIIYILSYELFPNVYGYSVNSIKGIIKQIGDMYHYHSTLTEGHPFESSWYNWPLMIKPVWYHVAYYGGNLKSTIVGIGNPIIWWFGILASLYVFMRTMIRRESNNFFITVFILCTFVPYIFIGRAMFMYHFFPTLPFIILAIVSFIKWITEKLESNSFYIFYVALVIIIFLVFYPVTSGLVTTSEYVNALKWLSSWNF